MFDELMMKRKSEDGLKHLFIPFASLHDYYDCRYLDAIAPNMTGHRKSKSEYYPRHTQCGSVVTTDVTAYGVHTAKTAYTRSGTLAGSSGVMIDGLKIALLVLGNSRAALHSQ